MSHPAIAERIKLSVINADAAPARNVNKLESLIPIRFAIILYLFYYILVKSEK